VRILGLPIGGEGRVLFLEAVQELKELAGVDLVFSKVFANSREAIPWRWCQPKEKREWGRLLWVATVVLQE
jgi:hypothetical protein